MAQKILARLGLADDIPTLMVGEIGYDTDLLRFRIGDGTPFAPAVMTTKSKEGFSYPNIDYVEYPEIRLIGNGTVDGVDISALNASNGILARIGNNVWSHRTMHNTDGYIDITNGSGVTGDPTFNASSALLDLIGANGGETSVISDNSLTGDGSGANPLGVVQATTAQLGGGATATNQEANAGTSTTRLLTPSNLTNLTQSSDTTNYLRSIIGGTTIITGVGVPGNEDGLNGQYYINETNYDLYGPKSGGVWPGSKNAGAGADLASTVLAGIVELATDAETNAGTAVDRAITPSNLEQRTGTSSRTGIVQLASIAEAQAGNNGIKVITPATLAEVTATSGRPGLIATATNTEAIDGTNTNKAIVPSSLAAALATRPETDLDAITHNAPFSFNSLLTTTSSLEGFPTSGFDAVGFTLFSAGQRTQFASVGSTGKLFVRTDDAQIGVNDPSNYTDWEKVIFEGDLATEDKAGILELATNVETQTGTVDDKAVTPASLSSRTATTTRTGLIELASTSEAQTGTDTVKAITPANLSSRTATATRTGLIELATDAEVKTGTDTVRAITPKTAKDNYLSKRVKGDAVKTNLFDYFPVFENSMLYIHAGAATGAFELSLPSGVNTISNFISMDVKITELSPSEVSTYTLFCYIFAGAWNTTLVRVIPHNGAKDINVRFTKQGDEFFIYFGDVNQTFSFPSVVLSNVNIMSSAGLATLWDNEIEVNQVTAFKGTINRTINVQGIKTTPSGALDVTGAVGTTSYVTTSNAVGASTRTNLEGVAPSTWARIYTLQVDDRTNGTANTYLNVYRRTA